MNAKAGLWQWGALDFAADGGAHQLGVAGPSGVLIGKRIGYGKERDAATT
jgi:hypothetical protein